MFTGIIESIGIISKKTSNKITIQLSAPMEDLKLGSSIAVDGVCLTVSKLEKTGFTADVMPITFKRTTLGERQMGDEVNLERAMTYGKRFEGHMVAGHVEGVLELTQMKIENNAYLLSFQLPEELSRFVVETGSIALNGISLTVAALKGNTVMVSIIPHTWDNTNLHNLKIGDKVNVETDMLVKYAEKLTHSLHPDRSGGIPRHCSG